MPTSERPDGPSEEARESVRELIGLYAQSFQKKCRRIEERLDALHRAPSDAESLEAIQFLLHGIKGSAGTFGFAAASRLAADWESALDGVTSVSNDELDQMHRRLEELGAAVR